MVYIWRKTYQYIIITTIITLIKPKNDIINMNLYSTVL